jgi:hypothetical protein
MHNPTQADDEFTLSKLHFVLIVFLASLVAIILIAFGRYTSKPASNANVGDRDVVATRVDTRTHNATLDVAVGSTRGDSRAMFYNAGDALPFRPNVNTRVATLEEAVDLLAKQFERDSHWIRSHMGNSNDLLEIHGQLTRQWIEESNLVTPSNPPARRITPETSVEKSVGRVNLQVVAACRRMWQSEGMGTSTRERQRIGMMAIVSEVRRQCATHADAEATLNHIQESIQGW